jgi:hypothetical protein
VAKIAQEEKDKEAAGIVNFNGPNYPNYGPRGDILSSGDDIWGNFELFCENKWFRRVRVIQEVAQKIS